MFVRRASRVIGGSFAEPMLCQWAIWWRRIPSTKPPRPSPRTMPAVLGDDEVVVVAGGIGYL
jgi:hypothetical protein